MTLHINNISANIKGVDLAWQLTEGAISSTKLLITMMWNDTALAGL
jgi:hypothetical protein